MTRPKVSKNQSKLLYASRMAAKQRQRTQREAFNFLREQKQEERDVSHHNGGGGGDVETHSTAH